MKIPYIILESNFGKDKNFTKPQIVQQMIDILIKNKYTPFPTRRKSRRLKEGPLDPQMWQNWDEGDTVWLHKSMIKTKTISVTYKDRKRHRSY